MKTDEPNITLALAENRAERLMCINKECYDALVLLYSLYDLDASTRLEWKGFV